MKLDFSFVSKGAIFANTSGVWVWSNSPSPEPLPFVNTVNLHPFFSNESEAASFTHQQKFTLVEFGQWIQQQLERYPAQVTESWNLPDYDHFKRQVNEIHTLIKENKIQKAVACDFAINSDPINTYQILIYLKNLVVTLKKNTSVWAYGCWSPQGGVLGLTPELLFYRNKDLIKTMAVAGTQAVDQGAAIESLLSDPKERAEHQAVIDDITQQLSPMGDLQWDETKVVEFPQLRHLKTELNFTLERAITTTQLIELLHPTAALGVYPRAYGINFLQQWQKPKLKGYHGGVMHINVPDMGEFALVMIRNVQWDQVQQWVAVGMGIVEASNPLREWEEWLLKFKMIKNSLLTGVTQ